MYVYIYIDTKADIIEVLCSTLGRRATGPQKVATGVLSSLFFSFENPSL